MTASIRNGNEEGYYAHINPDFLATFWSYFDEHFRSFGVVAHAALHQQGPIVSVGCSYYVRMHGRNRIRSGRPSVSAAP
jgi:hypothetical protein